MLNIFNIFFLNMDLKDLETRIKNIEKNQEIIFNVLEDEMIPKFIEYNYFDYNSNETEYKTNVIPWASKNVYLKVMEWAYNKHYPIPWNTCKMAAENGHLDCLKYAYKCGCEWDYTIGELDSYNHDIQEYTHSLL